ncbi:hypothetical protein HZB07_03165 [Candidatus Saganbacteria bacterium]|nr:hypothetical protein [Candidatus Saganbacteria bacterium]
MNIDSVGIRLPKNITRQFPTIKTRISLAAVLSVGLALTGCGDIKPDPVRAALEDGGVQIDAGLVDTPADTRPPIGNADLNHFYMVDFGRGGRNLLVRAGNSLTFGAGPLPADLTNIGDLALRIALAPLRDCQPANTDAGVPAAVLTFCPTGAINLTPAVEGLRRCPTLGFDSLRYCPTDEQTVVPFQVFRVEIINDAGGIRTTDYTTTAAGAYGIRLGPVCMPTHDAAVLPRALLVSLPEGTVDTANDRIRGFTAIVETGADISGNPDPNEPRAVCVRVALVPDRR